MLFIILFLHQTTTLSHTSFWRLRLFIILFLHQTTTLLSLGYIPKCCLSSCSYIKPQQKLHDYLDLHSCLSSCSYIKPQLYTSLSFPSAVVYHLVPTSNHNTALVNLTRRQVVYHLVPTSNHNLEGLSSGWRLVVYHLVPTSNHNHESVVIRFRGLFIILFLHQTTTRQRWSTL